MLVTHAIEDHLPSFGTWEDRFGRADGGLLVSWARGREKAREYPELASAAMRGELPVLPWKGGLRKPLNPGAKKYGALFYLAMWQGLRGDQLYIDTGANVSITCSKYGNTVIFTNDIKLLAPPEDDGDDDDDDAGQESLYRAD